MQESAMRKWVVSLVQIPGVVIHAFDTTQGTGFPLNMEIGKTRETSRNSILDFEIERSQVQQTKRPKSQGRIEKIDFYFQVGKKSGGNKQNGPKNRAEVRRFQKMYQTYGTR
jgi:hypothetical protein